MGISHPFPAQAANVLPVVLRRRQQAAPVHKATDPKVNIVEADDDPLLLPNHRVWRSLAPPPTLAPPPSKVDSPRAPATAATAASASAPPPVGLERA